MTLALRDLRLTLPGAAGPVLDGISLSVPPGARLAIIGDNGSGKTTLARCMAGWHPHDAVQWRGRPWSAHEPAARIAAVQMVGQRPDLQLSGRAPSLRREVGFAPENLARPPEVIARATDAALQAMGLAALSARDCRSLSGGEAQRLAIASALAVGPDLLILDEPVTDLDAAARRSLAGHLTRLRPDMAVICLDVQVRPWMRDFCQSFHHLERGHLYPIGPDLPAPEPAHNGDWMRRLKFWAGSNGKTPAPKQPSMLDVMMTSVNIMQMRITRSRMAGDPPEVIIAPRLSHLGQLDFHRAQEAIEEGRRAAQASLPQLRQFMG